MEAFSLLDQRPQTDVMANRPTTDVQKGPPVTQHMANAPGGKAGTALLVPTPAATPRSKAAVAKTAYDNTGESTKPAPVPGASTDLGASRDADEPEPKRPLWIYLLPVTALGVVGAFVWAVTVGPLAKHEPVAATSAPPPPSAIIAPPPAVSSTPAVASSSPPAASSVVVAPPPKASPVVPNKPPPNPNHPLDVPFKP
jgi:hypothetical protein